MLMGRGMMSNHSRGDSELAVLMNSLPKMIRSKEATLSLIDFERQMVHG